MVAFHQVLCICRWLDIVSEAFRLARRGSQEAIKLPCQNTMI